MKLNRGLFAEVDAEGLAALPEEYAVRVFACLLRAFGGEAPPARLSQIEQLVARTLPLSDTVRGETLGGCRIARDGAGPVRIWREWGRDGLPAMELQPGEEKVWDRRFSVALGSGETEPVTVRALGTDNLRRLDELGHFTDLQELWCSNRRRRHVAVVLAVRPPCRSSLLYSCGWPGGAFFRAISAG